MQVTSGERSRRCFASDFREAASGMPIAAPSVMRLNLLVAWVLLVALALLAACGGGPPYVCNCPNVQAGPGWCEGPALSGPCACPTSIRCDGGT